MNILHCAVECNRDVTFQCYDGTCIPRSRMCDGIVDCAGRQQEDEPEECLSTKYESCVDYANAGTTKNGVYTISVSGLGKVALDIRHFLFIHCNCAIV